MSRFATRGIWCGSVEAGRTKEEVSAFIGRIHDAGFNALFMHLKGGDGLLYWPSDAFPRAIAPGYESFDLPDSRSKSAESVECSSMHG
jgi:uncharacterized lipoprotein YddW (UPF0748 family)